MAVKFPKSEKYNFNKNLVKHHKLATHLDLYLGTEVADFQFTYTPKEEDHGFHPSGHCTPPPSALYEMAQALLTGNFVKKEWGAAMLKTFMVGHFWHQLLQKAVLDLGFAEPSAIERKGKKGWGYSLAEPETPWHSAKWDPKPYHWATGAGDVAPCSIPGHGDYVVDFKTMSSHQFKTNGIPDWAADKYEAQINIYMDFFELERGLIVAVNKDSPHDFKEFEFERNQELIDRIYDKWEFVSACLDEGEAPSTLDDELFNDFPYTGPVAQ
jgi:hypothetical protein